MLKLAGEHFVQVQADEAQNIANEKMTHEVVTHKLRTIFKNNRKFKIVPKLVGTATPEGKSITKTLDFPTYDRVDIGFLNKDAEGNNWIISKTIPRVIRKFSSEGFLLAKFQEPYRAAFVVSKVGNLFVLELYSDKPGNPQNLEGSDYKGIRVRKYTLQK